MIVYKGVMTKAYVEVSAINIPTRFSYLNYPGAAKISMSFSDDTELSFHVVKRQEKRLNSLLEKALKGMNRIIIKIEEEKNAT